MIRKILPMASAKRKVKKTAVPKNRDGFSANCSVYIDFFMFLLKKENNNIHLVINNGFTCCSTKKKFLSGHSIPARNTHVILKSDMMVLDFV